MQKGRPAMFDTIVNFFHLLATAVWIGGMIYIHFVLQPALKSIDPQQSGKLQSLIAKRFSIAGWSSVIVLLVTGYLKTPDGMLFDASSDLGLTLFLKHVFVIIMIIVGLVIVFYVVPNLQKSAPKPGEKPNMDFIGSQKKLKMLGNMNLVLGLLVLVSASMLW
jgi:uncharacterized membrane protein